MLGVLWTVGCVGQWEADPCPKLRFLTQSNSQARGMDCITSAVGHAQQGFCCCCSVPKSYPTLCSPVNCSTLGFPVLHHLLEFAQIHIHCVNDASNHLILCHPLLLLPSIFSSIRVFSNELDLGIRWPKYWSFSFRISPSNGYSGLISFRIH